LDSVLHDVPPSAHQIKALSELDEALRAQSISIDKSIGAETLASWRYSMDPQAERWWWALDNEAASARVKLHPASAALTTLILGVSFAVTADTVGQLLKVSAISAGLVAVVVQAVLTFITGSALTESGRLWVLNALAGIGVRLRFRDAKVMILALIVLSLSIAGRAKLPEFGARYYSEKGDAAAANEAWSDAIDDFTRSLTLRADNPETRFKLALAYDRSQDSPKAIEEYKSVLASDPLRSEAINNLARLYIITQKEPYAALRLLDRLNQNISALSPEVLYYVFKNRGWAKLELQLYGDAEGELRAALRAQAQTGDRAAGAGAHYLLARALEELKRPEEARKQFQAMIEMVQRDPQSEHELEPDWVIYAQNQLLQGGDK